MEEASFVTSGIKSATTGRSSVTIATSTNRTLPNPRESIITDGMTTDDQRIFPTDVRHSLPMALLRAREAVMRHYRPMLDAHGVTEQQWRVLRVLAETEALDASEVAARANILAPSLTRMIRSMADRGLIERGSDDNDARRVMLRIGGAGREVIHAASPESRRIYHQIESRFGTEQMVQLVELLNFLSALNTDEAAGD